jgi:hypothetical protein
MHRTKLLVVGWIVAVTLVLLRYRSHGHEPEAE